MKHKFEAAGGLVHPHCSIQEAFIMKNCLVVATLVLLVCSMSRPAQGQVKPSEPGQGQVAAPPGWCQGCTNGQKAEIATREARQREVSDHNQWPGKPSLSASGVRSGVQYAQFKTHFLVNNDSDKKIKRITWECTLLIRATKEPIQTFTLVTRKGLAPHKSTVFSQKVTLSFENLLGARIINQLILPDTFEVEDKYQIREIEYADGSVFRP
jgi:hypothetical protein